jgi:type VI protein secretion system component Hcp
MRLLVGAAASCALLLPLAAGAGGNLLVSVPGIKGTSTVLGFEQQIEARSVSFSASAPNGAQPALGPITVTKAIDDATAVFFDALAKGKIFPSVVINNVIQINGRIVASERYTLTNVKVTDHRIVDQASNSGVRGTEQLTLVAAGLRMETIAYDPNTGAKAGSNIGSLP